MAFELAPLPFSPSDFPGKISAETFEYHHGKHHRTYVDNLNKLVKDTAQEHQSLIEIIKNSSGPIFNNAAQVWNHDFYWKSIDPNGGKMPSGKLTELISKHFGSFAEFKTKFSQAAVGNFGSGWTWLVQQADGSLAIVNTSNADNPLTKNQRALLTVDVWEHAYYIDYRNARAKYVDMFFEIANWEFATNALDQSFGLFS